MISKHCTYTHAPAHTHTHTHTSTDALLGTLLLSLVHIEPITALTGDVADPLTLPTGNVEGPSRLRGYATEGLLIIGVDSSSTGTCSGEQGEMG